jgi:hypothetical protein
MAPFIWNGSLDWIDLAQNRNNWRAVVYVVINILAPKNAERMC